ncbi:diacylglycerol/lipid kinase family protein [Nocardioides mesophilus]|uniref:Diacylglycerol kinase n=1 Tax=Nocardioides mesophilus TaxID=433659 RepID=A0A7G9RGJ9_9ACTN|nr:diacylglycerol kinase family protein [Nocardioides mesophilus]QNN54724.1 diacylglycerol kinase [Nocardioides mesophilus]
MTGDDEQERAVALGGTPVPTTRERWLARLAFAAATGAVVVLLAAGRGRLTVLAVGVLGLALMLAGAWWFLSRRGVVRWLAASLVVAAPIGVLVFYASQDRLNDVVAALLLAAVALTAARAALTRSQPPAAGMPERRTPPPARPRLIMNPRSGGGKVARFGLVAKAEELGADVTLLDGTGLIDVAELARAAVVDGADLLGVAGGDGTQALVAGIASQHGLPFLVISAGTRNHFALDLGLDRDRPDLGLDALRDGVEVRIDLGLIGDRTFVNNASFGAYADVVQSPAYRDDKRGTTLQRLPDILSGHRGPRLVVRVDDVLVEAPKALLVSNNPYALGDVAGLGRRARLDTGVLGVVAITVDSAAQAAGLLAGHRAKSLQRLTAREVVVDADVPEIPVGIDGEAVLMPTPVRCSIQPLALRVRLPVDRPGLVVPKALLDLTMLRHQAGSVRRAARDEAQRGRSR